MALTKRSFPYPYKAMLAICSDIDWSDASAFNSIHQFLNTESSSMGTTGVGLDVGDSFWFESKPDTYPANTHNGLHWDEGGSSLIVKALRTGWMDAFHSYGDYSAYVSGVLPTTAYTDDAHKFARQYGLDSMAQLEAALAAAEVETPSVWMDHGDVNNRQNFASGGYGGVSTSPAYHTDYTLAQNRVRFAWGPLEHTTYPDNGPWGKSSYLTAAATAAGQKFWQFGRYVGATTGNVLLWSNRYIHQQLTTERIDQIVNDSHFLVVAQHFGADTGGDWWTRATVRDFTPDGIAALKNLRARQNSGEVVVARTSRLLKYNLARDCATWTETALNGGVVIDVTAIADTQFGTFVPALDDVRGLSWYVSDSQKARVTINGSLVPEADIMRAPADHTGQQSVGIRWYEADRTDYVSTDVQDATEVVSLQSSSLVADPDFAGYSTYLDLTLGVIDPTYYLDVVLEPVGAYYLDVTLGVNRKTRRRQHIALGGV